MPRITKTSILLPSVKLGAGAVVNLTQWTDYSWADSLTFIIDVQQSIGSPTAGTLNAKFQKRVPWKIGAYQYHDQRLVDFAPEDAAGLVVEGDWPNPLAAYNMGAAITWQRTVRNFGAGVNLQLSTNGLTGGTNPAFQTTVLVIAKG